MGIDYLVKSYKNPDMFVIIKWEWRDINWRPVMEFLDVEFSYVYQCLDPYITEEEVIEIRENLKKIVDNDSDFLWDEERRVKGDELRKDAEALLEHFDSYVEQEGRICVF